MPEVKSIHSKSTKGYLVALASAAVLSTTAILIRHLTQSYHLPPLVLAFWRDGLVFFILLPVLGLFNPVLLRLDRSRLFYLGGFGLVLASFNALWTLSVALNGAAVSTVLAYSSTGLTLLLGWCFLKERLNSFKILAVAFSLGGCAMVAGALNPAAWNVNLTGIVTGILSGLCYALYTLMGRSAARRGLNPWTVLLYSFGFAALVLFLCNLLPVRIFPGATGLKSIFYLKENLSGWGVLFLLAAGPTVIGFGLYNISLGYLPAGTVNLIAALEPVFTAITAFSLLGERLSGMQLCGGLMILAGVLLLWKNEGNSTASGFHRHYQQCDIQAGHHQSDGPE